MFDPVRWSELGKQYGPFFFAILFLMVITRWAYKIYRRANLRTDPPASAKEKSTYRYYFIATASFGMLLVIAAVTWWWINQPSIYVFRGEIVDLKDHQEIDSFDFYLKEETRTIEAERMGEDEDLIFKKKYFIHIQNEPIPENTIFMFIYSMNNQPQKPIYLEYKPDSIGKYEIEYDSLKHRNVLRYIGPIADAAAQSDGASFLFSTAYAQPAPPIKQKESPYQKMKLQYVDFDRSPENLVHLLQDERTDVGRKIEVLDIINNMDDEQFREFMEMSTTKEPMTLTILELGRHTDKELAYKARRIMNNRVDFHNDLTGKLLSDDPAAREAATSFLFRIEPPQAEEILNSIPEQEQTPLIVELKEKIIAGDRSRVLIPTGSKRGDRYYVRANWDPNERNVVDCLTRLFNRELITERTLEEEMEIMSGREERLVYWYSKEWALRMAGEIIKCGGTANFVGF